MFGIGSGYSVPLVLGLPLSWGSPLDQSQVPGPECAPLDLAQADFCFLEPLKVAGPSGAVATVSPFENIGTDLSVHVHVTCKGAVRVVTDSLGYHFLPNQYIYYIGL